MATYVKRYLEEVAQIAAAIEPQAVRDIVDRVAGIREKGGRLFFLGVGGSAATASHAANDFRKICGIESYAPTDNAAELTARVNDEGWETCLAEWLRVSHLRADDGLFVLSVGGGDEEKHVSECLVNALKLADEVGATKLGLVGRQGGYTAQVADGCIIIPPLAPDGITAHTEAFHSVLLHLIVNHPALKQKEMKWESIT